MIIAATGHRPDKLGGYGEPVRQHLIDGAMRYLEQEKPDEAISGMALGWDQAWAIAAIRLGIPLTCALPFYGQKDKWLEESQYWWKQIVSRATKVHYVCQGEYAAWKLLARNKWMVDNSDKICALWNGSDGGTAHCVAYAQKKGKPVDNIWHEYQAVQA